MPKAPDSSLKSYVTVLYQDRDTLNPFRSSVPYQSRMVYGIAEWVSIVLWDNMDQITVAGFRVRGLGFRFWRSGFGVQWPKARLYLNPEPFLNVQRSTSNFERPMRSRLQRGLFIN